MLNNNSAEDAIARGLPAPSARALKDASYGAFAAVARAMGSAPRLELLDLLVQRPFTVDALARGIARPFPSTSQHLQVLRRANLVTTRRIGTSIEYALAPGVSDVLVALRRLATVRSAEVQRATQEWFAEAGAPETIDRDALLPLLRQDGAVLVDVRPPDEYDRGHIAGAINVPVDCLVDRILELPHDALIVATCRGPYCAFAADAVRILRSHGLKAVRFEDGVAEWEVDGGAIASSTAP